MTYKTKNLGGNRGFQQNKQHDSDSLNERRARLKKTVNHLFSTKQIPASWVPELARIGGFQC